MRVMKNNTHPFQRRISYKGHLPDLLKKVIAGYELGKYRSHKVIGVGYEDFNVILKTDKGKYFLKFFADFRDEKDCQRYVDIMTAAVKHGVSHPKLYQSGQGYFHTIDTEDGLVRLVAMEYVDGKTFFDLKQKPINEEKDFLVKQAALINSIRIKPKFVYDSWAVVNFLKEYEKIKQHLTDEDIRLIEPLAKEFSSIDIKALPHCFVHGDIIDTNVIRSNKNKVYILDFSVSNVYPRVQELAVMLCDILFDSNKQRFQKIYNRALGIYQKIIKLEKIELDTLPLYVQAAHAMHIVGAAKSAVEDGDSEENDHWIYVGREGLKFTRGFWN